MKWDKINILNKKLVLIAGIVTAIIFLYPIVINTVKTVRNYVEALREIVYVKQSVENALNYIDVLNGIQRANMYKVDSFDYGAFVDKFDKFGAVTDRELVEVKLRKSLTGDIFVFVPDGKAQVYSVGYNYDDGVYTYIDFDGTFREIYRIIIEYTLVK